MLHLRPPEGETAPPARFSRIRRVYIALSWAPAAALLAAIWDLGRMEGWGAIIAAPFLIQPVIVLSAALSCLGVALLLLRKRADRALVAATLLAASPTIYFAGRLVFR